jgi:hypothetical protein
VMCNSRNGGHGNRDTRKAKCSECHWCLPLIFYNVYFIGVPGLLPAS